MTERLAILGRFLGLRAIGPGFRAGADDAREVCFFGMDEPRVRRGFATGEDGFGGGPVEGASEVSRAVVNVPDDPQLGDLIGGHPGYLVG